MTAEHALTASARRPAFEVEPIGLMWMDVMLCSHSCRKPKEMTIGGG